jgi:drug/metabolite transporter (DMT)-like permease
MGLSTVMMVPILAVSRWRRARRGGGAGAGAAGAARPAAAAVAARPARGGTYLLVFAAGLLLALHFSVWITSLSLTSVTHSTVLVTMHPVLVIGASALLLRERVHLRAVYGSVGAIAGALILSRGGSLSGIAPSAAGNVLAFLGAVTVAGYMVIGRRARRDISAAEYNILVYGSATLFLVPIALAAGVPLGPFIPREYAIFAALAFFCTILGHGLFNWALRYVPATEISMAVLAEPVFASILAGILFREIPGPVTVAGALVILGSLAMVLYYERER